MERRRACVRERKRVHVVLNIDANEEDGGGSEREASCPFPQIATYYYYYYYFDIRKYS